MPHADPEKPDLTVQAYDVRDAQTRRYRVVIKAPATGAVGARQSFLKRFLGHYVGRCLSVFDPVYNGEAAVEPWAKSLDRRIEFLEQRVPLMRLAEHRFAQGVLSPLNLRGRTFAPVGRSLVRSAEAAQAADALALNRDWNVILTGHDVALKANEPEQSTRRKAIHTGSDGASSGSRASSG